MTEQAIKNIERKLNDLAESEKTYEGSVFDDTYRAYAQGISFTLSENGYSIEWTDGKAHIVKEARKTGTTREVVSRMPGNVRATLEELRKDYKNPAIKRDETRARSGGYVNGLRDGGLITERERQILFIYTTV